MILVVALARAIIAVGETHAERGLMPGPRSPTASRRELGSRLRALRTHERLTSQQVADLLGVSRWKVSRLETGKRGASEADIARLCDLYQVSQEQRSELIELAAEGKERLSWPRSLPDAAYFDLELKAQSISDYGLAVVPGLLQTPDYARELVRCRRSGADGQGRRQARPDTHHQAGSVALRLDPGLRGGAR